MTTYRSLALAAAFLVSTPAWTATHVVHVGQGGLRFVDEGSGTGTTTIIVGDTVEWQWESLCHTVTNNGGPEPFDSGLHDNPFTFTHTFSTPGSHPYVCGVHFLQGMTGSVVVQPAGPGMTTTTSSPTTTVPGPPTTSTTSTTIPLPPGIAARFAALDADLASFRSDVDGGVRGKSKTALDRLTGRAGQGVADARTRLAEGQPQQAKVALRHAIRTLTTLGFRLRSHTARGRIPADVRTKLLGEVRQLRRDTQSLLRSV